MTDETTKPSDPIRERVKAQRFDVEHALGMYATGFCTFPAEVIYDKEALAPMMASIADCHIYLVGFVPRIESTAFRLEHGTLEIDVRVLGKDHTVKIDVPAGWALRTRDGCSYLEEPGGEMYEWSDRHVQQRLSAESGVIDFDVKYIGQAYGQDGSRNALDRLLKHETLQKIALKGVPEGYRLTLLLLSIEDSTQLFTVMNPFALNKDNDGGRVRSGLDKLFNTSEQERITLFEASLIRYFCPEYNKEFKDSFPSTNLKVLQDCYDKDFSAVIAEINHDEIPFRLKSDAVAPSHSHIAKHYLHQTEDRKMFCGL